MYGVDCRHNRVEGYVEKCPICLEMFQDFIKVNDDQLACYKCGCVFMRKAIRDIEKNEKQDRLKKQEKEFKCKVCKKKFKSRIALAGHSRSHK